MPLRSGHMRHYVTIQQQSVVRAADGSETITWIELDKVYAWLRPSGGRESFIAQQDWSTVGYMISIRFRTDVTPKMRVLFGSRIFRIEAVVDPTGRREALDLRCIELLDTVTAA